MTADFFNHNRIPACAFKPPCGGDMLSELKCYCSPEEQKQLDMMIGMIKAQKIQAALAANPCAPPPGSPPPGKPPCDGKPGAPPSGKPPCDCKPGDSPGRPPCDYKPGSPPPGKPPGGGKPDKNPDRCPPPRPPCQPSPIDMLSGFLSPEQLAMCRKFEDLL